MSILFLKKGCLVRFLPLPVWPIFTLSGGMANKEKRICLWSPMDCAPSPAEPCGAGCLLCSHARPPPGGGAGRSPNDSRNRVFLKDRKDQKREHKNVRYLCIWVTGQVLEREHGEGRTLPQTMYAESECCTF